MPKTINLSRGKVAVVDDADYEWLNQWEWSYATNGYAVRRIPGTTKIVSMHRQIMGEPEEYFVDHINRDTLDNRRSNLRVATAAESIRNTSSRGGTSIFKGVRRSRTRWAATIQIDGESHFLGHFLTQREAADAYNRAAQELFGPFACLNDLSLLPPEQDQPLPSRQITSDYYGVFWDRRRNKWTTKIMVNRKHYFLGYFDSEREAAASYDQFVKEHKLNRRLNFIK